MNYENGWVKQDEWHGNPLLGFTSYKKIFDHTTIKIPVYVYGKEGYGKQILCSDGTKRDFPDYNFVVSAGANSQYSYSGSFRDNYLTLEESLKEVDRMYKEGKLIV